MFRNFCEFWGVLGARICEFWFVNSRNFYEFSVKFGKIHGICEFFGVNLGVARNSRKFCEFLEKFREIHGIQRGENV